MVFILHNKYTPSFVQISHPRGNIQIPNLIKHRLIVMHIIRSSQHNTYSLQYQFSATHKWNVHKPTALPPSNVRQHILFACICWVCNCTLLRSRSKPHIVHRRLLLLLLLNNRNKTTTNVRMRSTTEVLPFVVLRMPVSKDEAKTCSSEAAAAHWRYLAFHLRQSLKNFMLSSGPSACTGLTME